jgi:hypothetical protein
LVGGLGMVGDLLVSKETYYSVVLVSKETYYSVLLVSKETYYMW